MEKKYTVTLRLSYQQYAWLGALCRRSKQTQSEVIRSLIENGSVRERITQEHIHIIRQLIGESTNLNQLARQANTYGLFGGCVSYVLKEEKSKLLEAVGVEGTPEQIAEQFELQSLLNDKVKNIVGHTSLNFSPEDSERLKHDDELMLQFAHDYMKLMGIENTQYIIARHIDREHPHCHIVFNRVDNDGKTISDKNDFRRNEKVCKMLTAKYRLHFANGKDHIKEERLRPYDRAKHEIYKALKEELSQVQNWADLKDALADRDIDMKFKVSRTTREIQGVKFEYNGFSFSGSKISREFSYLNIDNRLEENAFASLFESPKQESRHKEGNVQQSVSHSDDGSSISLGLLNGNSSYDATAAEEAEFNRLMKKKKAKRKRGFHL